MNEYDENQIKMYKDNKYYNTCECGNEMFVISQKYDENCEYIATVGVPCPKCGKFVLFALSVN